MTRSALGFSENSVLFKLSNVRGSMPADLSKKYVKVWSIHIFFSQLLDYYKAEVKTQVFANRKLKKTLIATDKFLGHLSTDIQNDHNKKNATIENLRKEVKAKAALAKVGFICFIQTLQN